MTGVLSGFYWVVPNVEGIYLEISNEGETVRYQRIRDGVREEAKCLASLRPVYDQNNGADVQGVVLFDSTGNPTGEVIKMRDFDLRGNLTWGYPSYF